MNLLFFAKRKEHDQKADCADENSQKFKIENSERSGDKTSDEVAEDSAETGTGDHGDGLRTDAIGSGYLIIGKVNGGRCVKTISRHLPQLGQM